jgi:ribonuclease Z
VSTRELVVLGTAAQVPTRHRHANGCFLSWDREGLLLDPGEGTQRQLILAGVAASRITRICVTHAHGDHCLGLPGVLQRLSLDQVAHPVELCFPAAAEGHIAALRKASAYHDTTDLRLRPVDGPGVVAVGEAWRLTARPLDHRIPTVGWRLEESPGRRLLPERLTAYGVAGPAVGRLLREGAVEIAGRRVTLEQVSVSRAGQRFAFVMDTRRCEAADALAEGVDLLVCEATFLDRDADLARRFGHLTAAQAAGLARDADARRLVLTHFSQRYGADERPFLDEARAIFGDVVAARDLLRVPVPARRAGHRDG